MPEELTCPWCKKEVVLTGYCFADSYFDIECNNTDCLVQPISIGFDTKKEAIDAWKQWK